MKPVLNNQLTVSPGMTIKLVGGKSVDIGGRQKYDWGRGEIVAKIEGRIIKFKNYSTVDWFTLDMPWEIMADGVKE